MQGTPLIIQPDKEDYWLAGWRFDPIITLPPLLLWLILPSHFRDILVDQRNGWLLSVISFIMISTFSYLFVYLFLEHIPILRPIIFIIKPIKAIYISKNLIMIKWGVPFLTTIIKRNNIYS